jgi:dihydrofolate reductase
MSPEGARRPPRMARVIANMSMSLDGFIADPDDGCNDLFGWYEGGPVEIQNPAAGRAAHLTEESASVFGAALASAGAFLVGRRLYDLTNGWNARPPADAPMVVLTHDPPDDWPRGGVQIVFATDIESAVAKASELAGERVVAVAGAATARACLDAGLLDEITVNLIPVVLGNGIPWFAGADGPVRLEDPEIVAARGVTHLSYRVRR